MAGQPKPKVLLFDIGGVCVVSPFKAILEYEQKHNIPTGYVNYCIRRLTPNGAWHKLERGEILCNADYFREFKSDLERPDIWAEYHQTQQTKSGLSTSQPMPPLPNINTEELYWTMMSTARHPDPFMFPALKKLKASGQFHLAALSNTTIFPPDAPIGDVPAERDVKAVFEVFVSSAHVGMRKPNRDIYDYTLNLLRERWGSDIRPEDVVFLDDIGENLKTAKGLGIRTIRVFLGKTADAVRELERVTGLELLEGDARAKL